MKYIVSEDVEIILDGRKCLLEAGDTIHINEGRRPPLRQTPPSPTRRPDESRKRHGTPFGEDEEEMKLREQMPQWWFDDSPPLPISTGDVDASYTPPERDDISLDTYKPDYKEYRKEKEKEKIRQKYCSPEHHGTRTMKRGPI